MKRHVVQINPFCCGAACMHMVYEYFGTSLPQEIIWATIQRNINNKLNCCPHSMQKHFHENGFCAIIVLVIDDLIRDINSALNASCCAIINYVVDENHNHFVLVEETTQDGILVQDPSYKFPNLLMQLDIFKDPQLMLVGYAEKESVCPSCNTVFPSSAFFDELYSLHISRCAYCGEELYFVDST